MIASVSNALLYGAPFLFVLTLVVTIHELGHFVVARAFGIAVDRFSIGFGRPLVHWTDRWGVEWRIGWMPLGGYVRFAGDAEASSSLPDREHLAEMRQRIVEREGVGAERRYFHFKPVWQRALVVAAGPAANFLLSIAIFAVLLGTVGELAVVPRVGGVVGGSPALRAGFRPGDVVASMDGAPVHDFRDIRQFVALRSGEPIRFGVRRGAERLTLVAAPERRAETDPITGASSRLGVIGLIGTTSKSDIYFKRYAPGPALREGAVRTWDILDTTVLYLSRLSRGLESGDQLGGPLRIAQTAGAAAKAGAEGASSVGGKLMGGLTALLGLAAVLSVGIGFMNLLPIPVLDGGHLVFYAYEAAARRPMAAQVQSAGYRVGLALLLGFMLFATWNDLQQLRVFKLIGGLFS